jgi:hypothetical protein
MDPKFKAFRDSIVYLVFGLFLIPCSFVFLTTPIRQENLTGLFLNGAFFFSLAGLSIVWGIRKFKKSRLPFKKDRRTKALTITEFVVGAVTFIILAVAAYFRIFYFYRFEGIVFGLVGLVAYIVFFVMLYDFLPEQVADESVIVALQTVYFFS